MNNRNRNQSILKKQPDPSGKTMDPFFKFVSELLDKNFEMKAEAIKVFLKEIDPEEKLKEEFKKE